MRSDGGSDTHGMSQDRFLVHMCARQCQGDVSSGRGTTGALALRGSHAREWSTAAARLSGCCDCVSGPNHTSQLHSDNTPRNNTTPRHTRAASGRRIQKSAPAGPADPPGRVPRTHPPAPGPGPRPRPQNSNTIRSHARQKPENAKHNALAPALTRPSGPRRSVAVGGAVAVGVAVGLGGVELLEVALHAPLPSNVRRDAVERPAELEHVAEGNGDGVEAVVIKELDHALLRLLHKDSLLVEREHVHAQPWRALRERRHLHRVGLGCGDHLPVIVLEDLPLVGLHGARGVLEAEVGAKGHEGGVAVKGAHVIGEVQHVRAHAPRLAVPAEPLEPKLIRREPHVHKDVLPKAHNVGSIEHGLLL
mmetsp:Transcript_49386/g.120531  ORF Transcript_49386/g.120531 Transcript_49386/m.120531 type:complete len:363 (+) Transcript_49386:404-1492(+)